MLTFTIVGGKKVAVDPKEVWFIMEGFFDNQTVIYFRNSFEVEQHSSTTVTASIFVDEKYEDVLQRVNATK
jgi:hypothetical protein